MPGHRQERRAGCIAAAWRRALRARRAGRRAAAACVIQAAARGAAARRRAALLRARAVPLAAASTHAQSPVPLAPSTPLSHPSRNEPIASPAVAGGGGPDGVANTGVADSPVMLLRCDAGDQRLQCHTQTLQNCCTAQEPRLLLGPHAAAHGCNLQAFLQNVAQRVQRPCAASAHARGGDSSSAAPNASAQPQPGGSAQLGAPAQNLADSSGLTCTTASASSHARDSHGMLVCAHAASVAGALGMHECGPKAAATRQGSYLAEDQSQLTKGEPNVARAQAARLPCTHAVQSVAVVHCNAVHPGHAALKNIPAAAPAVIALTGLDSERERERQEAVLPCADRRSADSTDMPKSPRCSSDHG